jgi:hypothetical protein
VVIQNEIVKKVMVTDGNPDESFIQILEEAGLSIPSLGDTAFFLAIVI